MNGGRALIEEVLISPRCQRLEKLIVDAALSLAAGSIFNNLEAAGARAHARANDALYS